jgi:hypothetical protein
MKRLFLILIILVHGNTFAVDTVTVLKLLRDGEAQLAEGRFLDSLEFCRKGLKTLGNEYSSDEVLDDTGLKLIAADLQLKEGKPDNAASVTCRILRVRYEQWERKSKKGALLPNHLFNSDALKRAG